MKYNNCQTTKLVWSTLTGLSLCAIRNTENTQQHQVDEGSRNLGSYSKDDQELGQDMQNNADDSGSPNAQCVSDDATVLNNETTMDTCPPTNSNKCASGGAASFNDGATLDTCPPTNSN